MPSTDAAAEPETAESEAAEYPSLLRANAVCIGLFLTALGLAGLVWFTVPHQHHLASLWQFLFQLTPFAAAAGAIAWLDLEWARRLRLQLVLPPIAFLAMFCFFVPRIFYYAGRDDDKLYFHMLTLVPLIILTMALVFRLGGGSRAVTLRMSGALLLLQLSGLEDLAYIKVNPHKDPKWQHIPDVWTWADHITVFLRHAPSKEEAFAFIAVHVVLALLVLFLPGRAVRSAARMITRRTARA
jgi:hypothetical protein